MNDRMIKLFGLKKMANETESSQALHLSGAYPNLEGMNIDELCEVIAYDIDNLMTSNKTIGDKNIFKIEAAGYFLGIKNADIKNIETIVLAKLGKITRRPPDYPSLKENIENEEEGLWDKFSAAFALGKKIKSAPYPAATPAATPGETNSRTINIVNDTAINVTISQVISGSKQRAISLNPGESGGFNTDSNLTISYKDPQRGDKDSTTSVGSIALNAMADRQGAGPYSVNLSELSNLVALDPAPKKTPSGGSSDSRESRSRGSGSSSSRSSSSSSSQTSTQKIELKLPQGQSVSDDWGTYTAKTNLSFDWTRKSDGKTGTYNSSNSGWNQSAEKINRYWAAKSSTQSAAPAGTAAAPEAGGATAEKAGKPTLNPIAVANVQAVLYRASTKALAFWTRQNEMGRIREMIGEIKGQVGIGDDDSALNYLAQVVYSRNRSVLDAFIGSEDMSAAIYRAEPKDLKVAKKGQYSKAVSEILKATNRVFEERKSISQYFLKLKSTATAAGKKEEEKKDGSASKQESKADDGSTIGKKSSFDPRIKKLAKLRRLRVRAQMEAAVEPSARFGRSRVS